MMKKKICYGLLLLLKGLSATFAQVQVDDSVIEQYYIKKCKSFSNDDDYTYKNLKSSIVILLTTMEFSFSFLPEGQKYFCSTKNTNLMTTLITQFAEFLAQCLEKEEHYLPLFIQASVKEFIRFWCNRNGENIKLFFSDEGKKCLKEILNKDNYLTTIKNCFQSLILPVKRFDANIICRELELTKYCFNRILEDKCNGSAIFNDLNNKFFKYISIPCSGCAFSTVNCFLLILSAIVLLHNKLF